MNKVGTMILRRKFDEEKFTSRTFQNEVSFRRADGGVGGGGGVNVKDSK